MAQLGEKLPSEVVSNSEAVTQLAHPGHTVHTDVGVIPSLTNIVRWSKPLKAAEFADAVQQTWDWPEVKSVVGRCRHKLLLGDLTGAGLPYKERYSLLSTVVIALAEITKPAAIHWEAAGCFVSPERLARRLTWRCNVRAHEIVPRKGDLLMDTLGLAALGLVDAQCLYRGLDPVQMALWMYGIAGKIFAEGDTIQDGESILGLTAGDLWVCHRQEATVPPGRRVVDIRPSGTHAGRM